MEGSTYDEVFELRWSVRVTAKFSSYDAVFEIQRCA